MGSYTGNDSSDSDTSDTSLVAGDRQSHGMLESQNAASSSQSLSYKQGAGIVRENPNQGFDSDSSEGLPLVARRPRRPLLRPTLTKGAKTSKIRCKRKNAAKGRSSETENTEAIRKADLAEKKATTYLDDLDACENDLKAILHDLQSSCSFLKACIVRGCNSIGGPLCTQIDEIDQPAPYETILLNVDVGKGEYEMNRLVKAVSNAATARVINVLDKHRTVLVKAVSHSRQWVGLQEFVTPTAMKQRFLGRIGSLDLKQRQKDGSGALDSILLAVDTALRENAKEWEELLLEAGDEELTVEAMTKCFKEALNDQSWKKQDLDVVNPQIRSVYEMALCHAVDGMTPWRQGLEQIRNKLQALRRTFDSCGSHSEGEAGLTETQMRKKREKSEDQDIDDVDPTAPVDTVTQQKRTKVVSATEALDGADAGFARPRPVFDLTEPMTEAEFARELQDDFAAFEEEMEEL